MVQHTIAQNEESEESKFVGPLFLMEGGGEDSKSASLGQI
jgi:hypothetical protein